jgi:hypothetical protein
MFFGADDFVFDGAPFDILSEFLHEGQISRPDQSSVALSPFRSPAM